MGPGTAKGRLFFCLSLIVFFPLLEHSFSFIESGNLQGVFIPHPDIQFSFEKWWDGSYQNEKTLFLNDSTGFRPDLIRLNDQIDFSFFNKLQGDDIYMGHNGYLYSRSHVDEYEGCAYMGSNVIRDEMIKLKRVQDTLERMGKTFVFCYAPAKPYYLPENIPDFLRPHKGRGTSNYNTFKRLGDSLHIKQLDYNALFIAMKDTSRYPLFTKQGVHWSVYGSVLSIDTLKRFIERERKIKMPELVVTKIDTSDVARRVDNDLAKCANLILPISLEKFYYPVYHYSSDSSRTKPRTIFIGDSFVWLWEQAGIMQNLVSNWEYWYYFHDVWNQNGLNGDLANYNWQKKLMETDCVVVLFTPGNLKGLNSKNAFIESMYDYFYPEKK